jgi:hypothetical protein
MIIPLVSIQFGSRSIRLGCLAPALVLGLTDLGAFLFASANKSALAPVLTEYSR